MDPTQFFPNNQRQQSTKKNPFIRLIFHSPHLTIHRTFQLCSPRRPTRQEKVNLMQRKNKNHGAEITYVAEMEK